MREFPNATKRPWVAEPGGGRGAWVKGATGEWTALACGDSDASADDNAALLVHAVNTYEQRERLLEEAAEVIRALNGFAVALEKHSSKGTGGRRGGPVFQKARAFLAKLEDAS